MKDNKLIVSRIAPPSRRKLASVKSTTSKHPRHSTAKNPTRNARRSRHALPTRHARLERASINESSRSKSQSKRQLSSVAESSTSKLSSSKSPAPVKASGMKSKPAPAKTRLVPDKYKPYMQRAFVSSLNSFIYKKPDFDSGQLYSLPIGKKILISRKIFRPDHNFGSFYKIFLFGDQKIVGYISEAEVIPEFLKASDQNYQLNPRYKKAKVYKDKNKVLNLEEIENITKVRKRQRNFLAFHKKLKKQVGLSITGMDLNYPYLYNKQQYFYFQRQALIGLDLSVQDLSSLYYLSAHVKSSIDFQKLYLEWFVGYRLLQDSLFSVWILGGATMDWDNPYNRQSLSQGPIIESRSNRPAFDVGPSGALMLSIPLTKKIHIHISPQIFYPMYQKYYNFNMSATLKYHF